MKKSLLIFGAMSAVICAFSLKMCANEHTHSYADTYSSDATYHWYAATCEHKDEVKDKAEHSFVGDTCSVCEYTRTVDVPTEHDCSYVDYICTVCDRVDPEAPATEGLEFEPIEESGEVISYMLVGANLDHIPSLIVIPDEYEGKPVTAIGEGVFVEWEDLRHVRIPDTVTSIGENAFGATHLRSIYLPEALEYLGDVAFAACCYIESIHIPKNVSYIGMAALPSGASEFDDTAVGENKLSKITVDSDNATFKSTNNCVINRKTGELVAGCKTSVIPDDGSVKRIGNGAFYQCYGLKELKIPNSVTSIGEYAFPYCLSLENIVIPDSVTQIEYMAFANSGIEQVKLPDGITEIEDGVFRSCPYLTSVEIPEGVTSIGHAAFLQCGALTRVVLPSTLTEIVSTQHEDAFESCYSLVEVVNLSRLDLVKGSDTFGRVAKYAERITDNKADTRLTQKGDFIIYEDDNGNYRTIRYLGRGWYIDGEAKYKRGETVKLSIPDNLSASIEIGDYTFCDQENLIEVVIPSGVTKIGAHAFFGCYNLEKVVIGKDVTSIGDAMFSYCEKLTDVDYAGTKQQWSALADGIDILGGFGAAGKVTVHCTDGDVILM